MSLSFFLDKHLWLVSYFSSVLSVRVLRFNLSSFYNLFQFWCHWHVITYHTPPTLSIVQVTAGLGTWNHYHDACTTTHLPVPASENHQESRQHAAHWRGTSVSHIDAAWREESGQGQRAQTLRKKTHIHRKIFGVFFCCFCFFYLSTALINCLRQDIFKNKQNIWSKNQLPIGGQSIRTGD